VSTCTNGVDIRSCKKDVVSMLHAGSAQGAHSPGCGSAHARWRVSLSAYGGYMTHVMCIPAVEHMQDAGRMSLLAGCRPPGWHVQALLKHQRPACSKVVPAGTLRVCPGSVKQPPPMILHLTKPRRYTAPCPCSMIEIQLLHCLAAQCAVLKRLCAASKPTCAVQGRWGPGTPCAGL
jgi:hypothetical protein